MSKAEGAASTVSLELDEMVCDLIGEMLDNLAVGEDPGVVVCLEDASSQRVMMAFSDDGEEQCLEAARQYVTQSARGVEAEGLGPVQRYAIAYAGCVQTDEGYLDALLVSFYEKTLPAGYSAYVLFEGAGSEDSFMWSDPEPAGEEPALI